MVRQGATTRSTETATQPANTSHEQVAGARILGIINIVSQKIANSYKYIYFMFPLQTTG